MKSIFTLILVAVFPFLLVAQRPQNSSLIPIVFQNVTVIDLVSGKAKPNLTVVVVGNRVSSVSMSPQIPKDAQVIDATGKFMIPGLWDMHSHSLDRWTWSSLLNIANGVTGVRDPAAVMPAAEIIKLREDVEKGRVFGPRFIASGRVIDGSPSSRASYITANTAAEMRADVKKRKDVGMDFI